MEPKKGISLVILVFFMVIATNSHLGLGVRQLAQPSNILLQSIGHKVDVNKCIGDGDLCDLYIHFCCPPLDCILVEENAGYCGPPPSN